MMNDQQLLEKYRGMVALTRAHRPREGGQISVAENRIILHLFEDHIRELEEKIAAARARRTNFHGRS